MSPLQIEGMIATMSTEVVSKKLFTVTEFHRLYDIGVLPEQGRFELIRGEIIEMPTPAPPHSGRVNRLNRVFTSKLGTNAIVSIQNAIDLDANSEPMPDVSLLRPRDDFYAVVHPSPQDVMLAVEVSHKSKSYDTNVKTPLYAEAGIVEYWQLDISKECLIVRSDPFDGEYRSLRTYKRGESVCPSQFPDVSFSVDELLG